MAEEKTNDYDGSSIKVLHGLEAVRKRPGMYIGDTDDGSGLHHMVFEAVDNSIDEALAGFCNHIEVTIHQDGSVSCTDNGRGIPVAMHPEEGVSAAEVVMTVLHAGGKFDSNSYKVSGGLHGVGISVVNALSNQLELTIKREGHIWRQVYLNGGTPEAPLHQIGDTEETGTSVRFWPSPSIFTITKFEYKVLANRLRELSFLNSGIKITLRDLREDPVKEEVFYHEGGIGEFVAFLNQGKHPLNQKLLHFTKKCEDNITVEVGMQWTDAYTENIYCFTNNVPQKDGGTHLAGFKRALSNTFSNYLEKSGLNKKNKISTTGDDARDGLTAVISVKMPDPKFSSQTKDKLVSSEASTAVNSSVAEALNNFLLENQKDNEIICQKIIEAARVREAVRKAKEITRGKKNDLNSNPDKLFPCREKDPAKAEVFLVEGDSAGGSAKGGRNSQYQAILPLRGKILNVQKATKDKVFSSQQIGTLVQVFGCGIGDDYDENKFKYHKVIIMTDADVDGAHIRLLLITFFRNHMPELIEKGYVYVAEPPLYKYSKGKVEQYIVTEEEGQKYKIKLAVKACKLYTAQGESAVEEDKLMSMFNAYNDSINELAKLFAKFDNNVIYSMLNQDLIDVTKANDESYVKDWTDKLVATLPNNIAEGVFYKSKVDFDPVENIYFPVIVNHIHGMDYEYKLDAKFLASSNFIELSKLNKITNGFIKPDGYVEVGTKIVPVSTFKDAYELMIKEGFKGYSVQRYKGLGEMSAEQLSKTTMDPDTRRVMQVDPKTADEAYIVLEQLMGEDVEYRKQFIGENFKSASLDV